MVEALRLEDGKLLVVIGPQRDENLFADYALRWGIETLFGLFKTRGFCLESTHFTEAERLRKLFALLTWALLVDENRLVSASTETDHPQKTWSQSQESFSFGI